MAVTVLPAASGGWLAFVGGARSLVVEASADDAFTTQAWSAVREPDGFQSLLDLLTSKGLAATPHFVLVEWQAGSDARIIVRGDIALELTDAAGTQSLSAAGVSTWVERTVPALVGLALTLPNATGAATALLPLEAGVALVARLAMGEPVAGAAPAAAPKATTPAKPEATPVAESAPAPVAASPAAAPVSAPAPASSPAPAPAPAPTAPAAPAPSAAPITTPPPPAQPEAEIDVGATMAGLPEREAEPSEPAGGGSYDYLFGDTVHRQVADAAVREPDEQEADGADAAAASAPLSGDHDGHTVLTADIAKLRGSRKQRVQSSAPKQEAPPKLVLVVSTTGAREPLTQPILVGRSPSVSKVSGGQIPRLITIAGSDQDISRNHVQIAVEGGTVVVTDLHSKNGTSIVLPGKGPQKLRAGEPASVIVGTVVDLGGGITLTVDEE